MKSLVALTLAATLVAAPLPVVAQEAAALPAVCTTGAMHHNMGAMSMGHATDAAHTDLMAGMDETNAQMMQGMMADDIDVAFICGMIPHHQAAINMARAELAHGDEQWARDLAQAIIDAQQREIDEMIAWLEQRG